MRTGPAGPRQEAQGAPGAGTAHYHCPPARQTAAILAIICISYFMVILDNSIIFTGLPRIEATMHFSPAGLTWVQDAYTLVFGGLLLLGARAGDIAGRRRAFTAGLVLFGLASLLVGAAPPPGGWWPRPRCPNWNGCGAGETSRCGSGLYGGCHTTLPPGGTTSRFSPWFLRRSS